MKKILISGLVVTILTSPAFAYDIPNHLDMSKGKQRSVQCYKQTQMFC